MKSLIWKGIAIVAVITAGLTSCKGELPEEIQSTVEAAKYDMQEMVADEVQKAMKKQLESFLQSADFGEGAGVSQEEKEKLQESFMEYLSEYELGTEDIEEVKESLSKLAQEISDSKDTKITKEEIDQRLSEMLQK